MIPIEQRDCVLPHKRNSARGEFHGKGLLVDGFEKSGPKLAMDRNRRCNDLLCDFRVPQQCSCVPAFLRHIKWFLSPRLFPNRGRGPWGRWESIVPRLILRVCIPAEG